MAFNLPLPNISDISILHHVGTLNELQKQRLENKYKPLETAIKAQNALAYSGKQGGINTFLKSFAQLPVDERTAYLSDPTNRKNYQDMLEQYRLGINSPTSGGSNVLSPEYIQSQLGNDENILQTAVNAVRSLTGGNNTPQAPVNQLNQSPIKGDFGANNRATDEEVNNIAQNGNNANATTIPTNGNGITVNANGDAIAPTGANLGKVTPDEELYSPLSEKQRDTLSAQMRANNKGVSGPLKARADSAVAFEKFIQLHRNDIQTVFKDAAKYNQLYGRASNWLQRWKTEQPDSYAHYIQAKTALGPLLANGVRMTEGMGISHDAQVDALNQVSQAVDKLDVSPETALKVFNGHIKTLYDVAQGILDTAEPIHPGVREKLAGIKRVKGDFIDIPKDYNKKSSTTSKVTIRNKDTGETITVSADEARKKYGVKNV
jgi:hypothetical protein